MATTLLDYLQSVRQQEVNRLTCQGLIQDLEDKIDDVENEFKSYQQPFPEAPNLKYTFQIPPFPEPEPVKPKPKARKVMFLICLVAYMSFFLVTLVLLLIFLKDTDSYYIAAFVGYGGTAIVGIIARNIPKKKDKAQEKVFNEQHAAWSQRKAAYEQAKQEELQTQNDAEHARALSSYMALCERIQRNNDATLKQRDAAIAQYEAAIDTAEARIAEIEETLQTLYNADIIYPKYRSLIPVTMFCEYIDSGRCTHLEGTSGAYNLYESELRANLIIAKLDNIHKSMDSLRQNQYFLYQSLTAVQSTMGQLSAGIHNQATLQNYQNRLLADKADALRSIEQDKLRELRALRASVEG